jgi:iron(III) transport system ATP-binding protein
VLRDGRVRVHAEPRALYHAPPDIATARSVGDVNVIAARIEGDRARCALGLVAVQPVAPASSGLDVRLLLRPEQLLLHLGETPGASEATVTGVQFHGHDATAQVALPDGQLLLACVPGSLSIVAGDRTWIEVLGACRAWPLEADRDPVRAERS